jgi:aldehyde:ferredoxin oxidoreductase
LKGYGGTILKVNLSTGQVQKELLAQDLAERLIGGKGFGTRLNCSLNPPGTDPLSPQNSMILTTGPGAGTAIPTATRLALFSRSPLSGLALESYVGGSFGHFMKRAGYDVIIIEGTADRPVYLKIIDDQVSVEDASFLWGRDIYETEDKLKILLGKDARVLSIGPAGENLVRYACIGHDKNRHFGRLGSGAVMGSKRLKAITLVGTGSVQVHDLQGLRGYVKDLNRRIREHPGTGNVYPTAGTVSFVAAANHLGVFPSHYWHRGEAKQADRIDFDYIKDHTLVKQTRCYACTIGCAHINRIPDGPYKGIEIDGPEYETIYVFGGLCDVGDIRDIIKLNDVCDRLGLDTMHTGNTLALLMDATEQRRIPEQFRIDFGDTAHMLSIMEGIARGDETWSPLSGGVRAAAEHFGLENLAIHVKGLEPAGYDPRGLTAMAVTFGVSNRGATHLSSNAYARDISGQAREHEIRGEDKTVDRFSLDRKAELVFNMVNFNAIADCFILCRFLNRDLLTYDDYAEMLYLLTGMEKKEEDFIDIANHIVTMGRNYNLREGLSAEEDMLPDRFFSEPNDSLNSGGHTVDREAYRQEIGRYYALRGWDSQGVPPTG